MPWRLLRFGLSKSHPEPRMFTAHDKLKPSYDVVIIGGGGHGLSSAYYLARDHGITNVAVLEKGYIGGGNTGRNTTIIRSNYLTPEGVKFYDKSVQLWQDLSTEFDLNLFYSTRGHFTLAHTDSAMRTMRWRAEVNKHYGIASEVVGPEEVKRQTPQIDLSCGGHAPIQVALYHAPGAVARHDAVAWGYGRGADMSRAARWSACIPPRVSSRPTRSSVRSPASRRASPTWWASRRRSSFIRCRPW